MTKNKYPFAKGDIVATKTSGRKGVVMSVGQMGADITAIVTWFDDKSHSDVPIAQLKKTLRGIDGGKDPDT